MTAALPQASADAVPPEPARPYGWRDDDPRTCARDDARYWDELYDRDEDS